MLDILKAKLVKRGIDIKALNEGDVELSGQKAVMKVVVQQGMNQTWRETGENDQETKVRCKRLSRARNSESAAKTRRLAGHHCHA